jgi:hypothetical protein
MNENESRFQRLMASVRSAWHRLISRTPSMDDLRHDATVGAQRAAGKFNEFRESERGQRAASKLHDLRESEPAKRAEAAFNDLRTSDAGKRAEGALSDLRQREPVKKAEESARKVMHDIFSGGQSGSESAS